MLSLPAIPEGKRKSEAALWHDFEAKHPAILGALLDAAAGALKHLPTTALDKPPRMADFALWAVAAEAGMNGGKPSGAFMTAYATQRANVNQVALEASLVAIHLRAWWEKRQGEAWEGSASDLLALLDAKAGEAITKRRVWPKNGRAIAGELARIAPNLRAEGINVTPQARTKKARIWRVENVRPEDPAARPSPPSPPSPEAGNAESTRADAGDGRVTMGDAKGDAGKDRHRRPSPADALEFGDGDGGDGGDGTAGAFSGDADEWGDVEGAGDADSAA